MKFLKNSGTYMLQHTKPKATKMLYADDRVMKINIKPYHMIIETNPLMSDGYTYPQLSLKPTGRYIITIHYLKKSRRLEIKMIRKGGGISNIVNRNRHHMHIDYPDEYSRVCFGHAQSEMDSICANKDWYWAGIMSLNLLQDFTDYHASDLICIEHLVRAQIKFARSAKFTEKMKKKVVNLIKKDEKLMRDYRGILIDDDFKYFVKIKEGKK